MGQPTVGRGVLPGGLLPLWPFQTADQASAWLQGRRAGTPDPQQRSDAAATALAFTREFLGYTGIDQITSATGSATDRLIGLGQVTESGAVLAAATLRLLRFGPEPDAPWVVVGTQDAASVLARPGYGATVGASFMVGGRITGVDEALRVSVLAPGAGLLGSAGPVGVGGVDQAWSVPVTRAGTAPGSVLTVAVATGGHLFDVEWFAVSGALAG